MKKITLLGIICLWYISAISQNSTNQSTFHDFESFILTYQPQQRSGVSEADYNKGVFFLNETKSAVKNNPANFNAADYWNVTMAFLKLKEPSERIAIAFQKAIDTDPASICAYIGSLGSGRLGATIPEVFYPFYEHCGSYSQEEEALDVEAYATRNRLNQELVRQIYQIGQKDSQYRSQAQVDWSKQRPLDEKNQQQINSLYQKYGTYIGRDLVGKKLETIMWAVIQHSNQSMMEKYLPVIEKEVSAGKLDVVPLKMLIDRLYWLKYEYQIFGSQPGVDLAAPHIREAIKKKYPITQ